MLLGDLLDLLRVARHGRLPASVLEEVEPANALERALAGVAGGETARRRLWQAVYDGEVVLPVVASELAGGKGERAAISFLSAPTADVPVVLGFATEARFSALLAEGSDASHMVASGHDLPKIWPAGHWMMLNAGYGNGVVLSPSEVTGLPHGSRVELPHPGGVELANPGRDDDDRALLVTAAAATVPGCEEVAWARIRPRAAADDAGAIPAAAWRDVLVVTPAPSADQAAVVEALRSTLPASLFPEAVVVGRHADLVHPLVEAVVAEGRPVAALT